ncbi:MAG: amidohydrolase family protein [Alphaproteobacteria bacterium]|nr:amidohydrolase family protein [Alphaproteobacteria bacterium]
MARDGFLILDSDLHTMEPDDLWANYLDEPYRSNPPRFFAGERKPISENAEDKGNADTIEAMEIQGLAIPAHATQTHAARSARELLWRNRARHPHFKVARASGYDPQSTLAAMDIEGIDVAVMYGTRGRQVLCHDDLKPDYAAALARAYNNWAADYCKADPRRFKFAAQIAMHDIPMAVEEARRCVTQLGAVAVIGTTNPVNGRHMHDDDVEPLWNALEELNVPIGFHPTGNTSLKEDGAGRFVGHPNFQPIAHAIRNPVELMGAIASLTTGGILERHPKLRCAFLEGTAGWLHWWLWRLDSQWEKFGPGCERQLSMLPSEYFRRQCYIALDVDEEPAVDIVNKVGADYFVVSTDYPHADGAFPDAMKEFFAMPLTDEQRRKILWDNCARLYAIETPAAPLAREIPQMAAAE